MTRHLVWQAALVLLGIALVFFILFQLVGGLATLEEPAVGGTYVEGVLGYSSVINPILAPLVVQANQTDQELSALVFDGLTRLDESGQVSPALATGWTVSEDGRVYEFWLREGVTWHDGAPFSAADAAFTVQAVQDPNYQGDPGLHELWRNVGVEQVDELTVRFSLAEPFPSFMSYTTMGLLPAHLLSAIPAADLPSHPFSTENPVGTGRLKVESISPDRVVLTPNPDYWAYGEPFLERLEFWFYGDEALLLTDYERGQVTGFHFGNPQSLLTLAEYPSLQLFSAPSSGYGIVYLNLLRDDLSFLQEKEVRQALLYALDRQAVIDRVLGGQGLVADSPILPLVWAYDPGVRKYGHDPERAIGLLDASGWLDSDGDGIRDQEGAALSFALLTSEEPTMLQMAEEMSNAWRGIGVDVTVEAVEAASVPALIRGREFDAALTQISLTSDPDPYPLWHSAQAGELGQNFSGFANQDADLIMEEGRFTVDRERRTELYHRFQQIFSEEVPSLLIYYPIYTYAVDKQVREVQLSPLLHTSDRFRNIDDWYMETIEVEVSGGQPLDKPDG